jgi:hypothetical protein
LQLRLKQENNALKDENQSLRYSSSYVTNSDRDQRSERLRLELSQLEGDKSMSLLFCGIEVKFILGGTTGKLC